MMAKHPEFKAPQDVRFKQPEQGLFDDEPAVEAPGIEWLDMPEPIALRDVQLQTLCYPYSGEPVWLTPDGTTEYIAVWRVTREFKDGRFQPVGFWALRNSGGQRIGFEPLGYRKYEEPIYTPKKRV
jgi:hypothetical protein